MAPSLRVGSKCQSAQSFLQVGAFQSFRKLGIGLLLPFYIRFAAPSFCLDSIITYTHSRNGRPMVLRLREDVTWMKKPSLRTAIHFCGIYKVLRGSEAFILCVRNGRCGKDNRSGPLGSCSSRFYCSSIFVTLLLT